MTHATGSEDRRTGSCRIASEKLVPAQCRSSRQISTGSLSAASSMRDCTSWRSQNKNSDEAWTSLSARRSERRLPFKQRVEEGTQLDDPPRLGRSPPDPERELSSHRYALVEQPRLAEPGASLHHDHATGPSADLAQPPAYDRELLLTPAERAERSVHFQSVPGGRSDR